MVLLWLTRRPLPLCAVGKGGRQKAQDKAQALTTAPVTGRLLRHLPYTLAALLFSAFYNVADTLFVSHGVGDLAAAGISVVFPLTVLQGAIAQMVGAGAGALVSPCLGQKDYRAAGRVTKSAMAFFYTTALGITCICLLFRTPLLRLFGATAEILPYARTYFTILAAGNVFSTGFSSIMRAEGRMDYSLWIWLLPTGVNLLLDWLLIYRLHLGIAGCGLGHGDRPGGELLYERIVFYPVFLPAIPWRAGGTRRSRTDLDSGAAHLGANGQSVCCAGGDERLVGASGRYGGCGGLWLCEPVGGICLGAVLRSLLGSSAYHRQQLRRRSA